MNKEQHLHAIKVAIIREQKEYKGFPLPQPQKTGTSVQQLSYAKQSAEQFYNKYIAKIELDNSDFIELVCDLADKVVVAQFGGADKEDDGDGGTRYTETAQDFFNEVYDDIEYLLNQKGIHAKVD